MRRPTRIRAAIAAWVAVAAGCGYPTFSYGPGAGGSGGAPASSSSTGGMPSSSGASSGGSSTSSSSSSTSASSTASSASSAASSSGIVCPIDHLLLSEVRSHGPNGAADEFIELYNPTGAPIHLDPSWTIEARTLTTSSYSTRWTASSESVPSHGHLLIAGPTFSGITPDAMLSVSITDAASVRLRHSGATIDALCYYHQSDPFSAGNFVDFVNPYSCESLPAANPHEDTTGAEGDFSLERKPGGAAGNCTDTDDNSADWVQQSPSTPQNTSSPTAP